MNSDNVVGYLIVGLLFLILTVLVGFLIGEHHMEGVAVKEGHAQYFIDDDHKRRWRWILSQPPEAE